ncbi:MAG: DUF1350 family protein [Leptolyngbyaceae cyanobacterium]
MPDHTNLRFRFLPTRFSWMAIHPQPVGIIYFIGGAFFGSMPTLFYRFLLKSLFVNGYTVVALPFRFSFRHWSVALSLAENQNEIRQALLEEAKKQGFDTTLYQETLENPQDIREYWIGHSLGCKYIALLELLTDFEIFEQQTGLFTCLGEQQAQKIDCMIDKSNLHSVSLYNQPSILLDPVISDLDNAVPIKALQRLLSRLIKVNPSRDETFCLIDKSRLFTLTSILSFNSQLAETSVTRLKHLLAQRLLGYQPIPVNPSWLGKHLAVLGVNRGQSGIIEAIMEQLAKSRYRLSG